MNEWMSRWAWCLKIAELRRDFSGVWARRRKLNYSRLAAKINESAWAAKHAFLFCWTPASFHRSIPGAARYVFAPTKSYTPKLWPLLRSDLHFFTIITNKTAIMAENAGGIDRKADERMEFSTSKEVTVHPTFESMSLKGMSQACD